jgi:hypothetical protein
LPAAPNAIADGSRVTPSLTRVTTPYSWSVPISSGAPPGSPAAACWRPSVSARTCFGSSTFVAGLVAPVGSSGVNATRISPARPNFVTISAGVSTPAIRWLPAAAGLSTRSAAAP